jgi:hypothetical protein
MQENKHLNVFDFDETLFRVPNYTVSEAKGIAPYDWFDSAESLDERFGIRGIANTINRTNEPGSNSILVTHRVKDCEARVVELLKENGIVFDALYFLGRGSHKASFVLQAIEGTCIESITVYEDTLWEIISYARIFEDAKISQDVKFVFVDKSKLIYIDWAEALRLANTIEFERIELI